MSTVSVDNSGDIFPALGIFRYFLTISLICLKNRHNTKPLKIKEKNIYFRQTTENIKKIVTFL